MEITLQYSDLSTGGSSHKEYKVTVTPEGKGHVVTAWFGRIGGTLQETRKTPSPVSLEDAKDIFDGLVRDKMRKGYLPVKGKVPLPPISLSQSTKQARAGLIPSEGTDAASRTPYPIENLTEVASETEAQAVLRSPKFWLQTKVNGVFCQIRKHANGSYSRFNKLGLLVQNLPAEVLADLKKIKAKTFFLAGELVGNRFIAENILELDGKKLSDESYARRFLALEETILAKSRHVTLVATWRTLEEKIEGLKALKDSRSEGAVFKLVGAQYRAGNSGQHFKFKFTKTLSAVVLRKGDEGKNSATLGLLSGGETYVEVGKCSLNGKEFVQVGEVVEVRYLYGTEGNRLYQPRMERKRTDVRPEECTIKQIIYQGAVA